MIEGLAEERVEELRYDPIPTLEKFHRSAADFRCVVGPVGSGKTSAAAWEIGYYLPFYLYEKYGLKHTKWCVIRNTYPELRDTTQRTFFDWFPFGEYKKQENTYTIRYPDQGITVEILFRACDNPAHVKKFKSLDLTGYWIDESIEVADVIKRMLKNRVGRFPKKSPVRYGIETTNPPDVEHSTYWQFAWITPPPGPVPAKEPLKNHIGFWQPPGENDANLRPGYYDDLRDDYRENPEWIEMYIEGRPGILVKGKLVYNNFRRSLHVAEEPLIYAGGPLYVGWDNSGNSPAAVVVQVPTANRVQVMAEYYTDSLGIVDFTNYVLQQMNTMFPGHTEVKHFGDPAGENRFSKRDGGFTSNQQLQYDVCGITIDPGEQNFRTRVESVDQMLARVDGFLIDPRCIRLINGFLGGYCYPESTSVIGEYQDNVIKNKYSHPHDALQYVMTKLFKPVQRPDTHIGRKRRSRDDYHPLRDGLTYSRR